MDDLNFGYLLAGGTCCKNMAIKIFLRNLAKLRPFLFIFATKILCVWFQDTKS
jgi:hypothetical protein